MSQRCVVVTVPKKGLSTGKASIKIEAEGYVGNTCHSATKAIETALGIRLEEESKPELYATNDGVEYNSQG